MVSRTERKDENLFNLYFTCLTYSSKNENKTVHLFFSVDPIKIVTFLEIIRVFSPISGRGQDIHKLRFISNFRTDFCARNEMNENAASHQNSSKNYIKSIRRFNSLYLC